MSTHPNPIPASYWWFGGLCIVGFVVTWYLLLDADITIRWAHNQYEIHEETAMGLSGLIWLPAFILLVTARAVFAYVRRSKSTVA